MDQEYAALLQNNTWDLCPYPLDEYIIDTKWVYKMKQKEDGNLDRCKARLVAKGFKQVYVIDYSETIFIPVVKPAMVCLVLAIVVHFSWPIRQLDISNAFLHGTTDEEVFIEQPCGYVDPSFPDYVCKLNKALYVLKQAPRAWFKCFSRSLMELDFIGSQWPLTFYLSTW